MCQMCDEANLYLAQLQAAALKAEEAKSRRGGQTAEKATDEDKAATTIRGK